MQKKNEVFWIFRIMLNDYYIIVHLNTFTHPLRELLQKKVDFDWTGTSNKASGNLKLCMNSDTCLSYYGESIYRE